MSKTLNASILLLFTVPILGSNALDSTGSKFDDKLNNIVSKSVRGGRIIHNDNDLLSSESTSVIKESNIRRHKDVTTYTTNGLRGRVESRAARRDTLDFGGGMPYVTQGNDKSNSHPEAHYSSQLSDEKVSFKHSVEQGGDKKAEQTRTRKNLVDAKKGRIDRNAVERFEKWTFTDDDGIGEVSSKVSNNGDPLGGDTSGGGDDGSLDALNDTRLSSWRFEGSGGDNGDPLGGDTSEGGDDGSLDVLNDTRLSSWRFEGFVEGAFKESSTEQLFHKYKSPKNYGVSGKMATRAHVVSTTATESKMTQPTKAPTTAIPTKRSTKSPTTIVSIPIGTVMGVTP